jgi:tetratricopeptide (TPR) repeat protein
LLKPFGPENRPPVFVSKGCTVISSHVIGNGRHLKLKLRQGKKCYDAIGFNMAKFKDYIREPNQLVNICYEIDFLNFSLKDYVQLRLKDIEFPATENTDGKMIDIEYIEDDVPDKLQYQIEIFKRMGNNYYFNQDYESAIIEYDKALQIKPDNSEILYHVGLVYKQLGIDEKAYHYFSLAIESSSKSGVRGRKSARKAQEMLKFMEKMNKAYT